jgi:hypothetical protein
MQRRSMAYFLAGLTGIGAAFLACLAAANLAAAEPAFPPGLRIGLELPPGVVASARFPGFEDADRKIAITILDLPGQAYGELEKGMFAQSPPGLTLDKREMFAFGEGIGFLATGHGIADGVAVHKWVLLANVSTSKLGQIATMVNVSVADTALTIYSDAVVRAALKTVTFRAAPLAERLKLLPFKLDNMADFRVLQVAPRGVMLIEGPGSNLSTQPYMIVEAGAGSPSEPDARGRFARDLLAGAPASDLKVMSAETMRINNLPGYEIRAQGLGLDGAPVYLVQWIRFGTSGFSRVIGITRTSEWDRMFPHFRAVRDGVDFN